MALKFLSILNTGGPYGSQTKILIVDDDANIAELISLYLLKECYDTKIVETENLPCMNLKLISQI